MSVLTEKFEFWVTAQITAGEAPLCLSALPSCLLSFPSISPYLCLPLSVSLHFSLSSSLCPPYFHCVSFLPFPSSLIPFLPLPLIPLPSFWVCVHLSLSHWPCVSMSLGTFFFFYLALCVCLKAQDINEKIRAEYVNIGNFFLDGPLSWFAFPSKSCELTNSLRISQTVRDPDVKKHLTITDSKCWAISATRSSQTARSHLLCQFQPSREKTSQKRGVKKNKVKVKPLTHLFPPSSPPTSHWLLYCVSEVLPPA